MRDITARACERYPGRRHVVARGGGQGIGLVHGRGINIRDLVGPIKKRQGEKDTRQAASRTKNAEIVGNEYTVVVRVQAGLGGENVIRCVRNQNRMIAGIERAVLLDEVQQIGHLLQIRRHVRIVAREMDVIEFHVNHMSQLSRWRVECTCGVRRTRERGREQRPGERVHKHISQTLSSKHSEVLPDKLANKK